MRLSVKWGRKRWPRIRATFYLTQEDGGGIISAMFKFKHHVIDTDIPKGCLAQTALADIDRDGKPEFIVGLQFGDIFYYKFQTPEIWTRHLLGKDSPSDVGGCVLDVDNDGWLDFVTGGAWYRNPRGAGKPFERIVFDEKLAGAHDVFAADVDGDGVMEIVTMSDQNDLRWYKIPDDPTVPWPHVRVGAPVHAGASAGDLDGDGHLDLVRTDVWFRNVDGKGTKSEEIPIGTTTPPSWPT